MKLSRFDTAEATSSNSGRVVFVGFRNLNQHPFVGIYRNGVWSGRDLTPGAGQQQLLAVTAAGGRGTVLAASEVTDRLYAIANI